MLCNVMTSGALEPLYGHAIEQGSERARELLYGGWTVIQQAITPGEVQELISGFDEHLEKGGFAGRWSEPESCQKAKNLPACMWGIDASYMPLTETAVHARVLMRRAFGKEFHIAPEQLMSSFDGVMMSHANYTTRPQMDAETPRLPIDPEKYGPAHVDQSLLREGTAESHQCYLALTPIGASEMSTAILVPTNGWTMQGMVDALREQFSDFYNPVKKRKKTPAGNEEGYRFPPEQQEWLFAQGMCKVVKPHLNPGDMIIWSSSAMHCGATFKSKTPRRARLGVISAFCPIDLVSNDAKTKLWSIVGKGFNTGQQIRFPSKHGFSFPTYMARSQKPENWPQAYKDLKSWRDSLKSVLLYEDPRQSDKYRTELKSLLGFA
jgi:hypothetical protein